MKTRQIRLANRPVGLPTRDTFTLTEEMVPELVDGQVLVRTLYLSVDPYMRGRMRDGASYTAPFMVGAVLAGGAVGEVLESSAPHLAPGDIVLGAWGWQDVAAVDASRLRRLDPGAAPISLALGLLGMPGLTAYFGLKSVATLRAGETVVASAAAGAVGSAALQIAKILGCRAVGIAGGPAKMQYLQELGADGAVDYRAPSDLCTALAKACPHGIDVYFENVGGPVTNAVLPLMNEHGRIAVCGQISAYNDETPPPGPSGLLWAMIVRRLRMQGFLIGDFAAEHAKALAELTTWYREGRLQAREHIVEGLENTPDAFMGLFRGDNIGKLLVKVS